MSAAGRHLVANPSMLDPNFARTVVFMLDHSDEGALGVVLNRPSELPVAGTVDEWADLACEPGVVYAGGPVSPRSVIALASAAPGIDSAHFQEVHLGLGTVDIAVNPGDVPGIRQVRLFAGYASWAPGQLDAELAEHAWHVVDAIAPDVHSSSPEDLWWTVLARQGGRLARLANFPHNLADN